MRRIRRILLAVKDPAAKASAALGKAAQLARALDAELVLFKAIAAPLYLESEIVGIRGLRDIERRAQDTCRAQLEAHARRLRRFGIRVSASVEWVYPAYEAVVRAASRFGADLILLTSSPHRLYARRALGRHHR
jgi:nucleotide-binding universal stress UspA family protein